MNYKRNNRNREGHGQQSNDTGFGIGSTGNPYNEYAEDSLLTETLKLEHKGDPQAVFYKQFLDSVHCFFIHAVDVGFRIQIDDDKNDGEDDDEGGNEGKVDLDSTEMYEDKQMVTINAKIQSQRKQLKFGRLNKFNTEIS